MPQQACTRILAKSAGGNANLKKWSKIKLTNKKLLLPFMKRKTFAQRSFSVAAPTLWNGLPLNVKQASTLNQFKSLLKTHLFNSF